jgi:hypothetical protein
MAAEQDPVAERRVGKCAAVSLVSRLSPTVTTVP